MLFFFTALARDARGFVRRNVNRIPSRRAAHTEMTVAKSIDSVIVNRYLSAAPVSAESIIEPTRTVPSRTPPTVTGMPCEVCL